MSAATDHEDAQRATLAARDALSSLNTLIATGDRGVSGADLMEAEADVKIAERLEAGALVRAQAEQEAAEAAAKEAANGAYLDSLHSSRKAFSDAIVVALAALSEVFATATSLEAITATVRANVPGYGSLDVLARKTAMVALVALAEEQAGITPTVPHPHRLIEPITPFLPVGVG